MFLQKVKRLSAKYVNTFHHRNRVYLLSHMRANTSLLGHILGSNSAIEGYYELHRTYNSERDLLASKLKYYSSHPAKKEATYLFDKLLHNKLRLDEKLVGKNDKLIFMIRRPQPTINSIYSLFSDKPSHKWSTKSGAEAYYVERLKTLQQMAKQFKGMYLFLKAEDLVEHPDDTLKMISKYLSLKTSLSGRYDTFNRTGKRGFGDSSENITSGKILQSNKTRSFELDITEETVSLYNDTLTALENDALISITISDARAS